MAVVFKFGGTSLRDHPYHVLNRVLNAHRRHDGKVVVVVSALAGITDALIKHDILDARCIVAKWKRDHHIHDTVFATIEPIFEFAHNFKHTNDNHDLFVSLGEKISALLFSELLCMYDAPAIPLWADTALLWSRHGAITCDDARIRTSHAKHFVPVVTGYCAFNVIEQRTCLLGRNGSDTTATIVASALQCDCVIFTDVQAIMTVDPRTCGDALPIHHMTFGEVRELAFHGASVLHGDCIDHAEQNAGCTLTVAHVSDNGWRRHGTTISHNMPRRPRGVVAMAVLEKRVGVSVRAHRGEVGFACRVFQKVCEAGVSVEMFSQTCSERSMCLLVPESAESKVVEALQDYDVTYSEDLCILTVVGESMRDTPGVAAEVCGALADHGINIRCISQGATEMSLSVAVPQSEMCAAVRAVHHKCLQ